MKNYCPAPLLYPPVLLAKLRYTFLSVQMIVRHLYFVDRYAKTDDI